jgi:wyosine [tRNA(Phe)-imidazoG37] synthetase (radical SAM superfamily)
LKLYKGVEKMNKEKMIKEIFENIKDKEIKEYIDDYVCLDGIEKMKIDNIIEYIQSGVVDFIDVKTPIYNDDLVKFMIQNDLFEYRLDEFFEYIEEKENFYQVFRGAAFKYLERKFYNKLNKMVLIPLMKIQGGY